MMLLPLHPTLVHEALNHLFYMCDYVGVVPSRPSELASFWKSAFAAVPTVTKRNRIRPHVWRLPRFGD
jgi:hypothetical protein